MCRRGSGSSAALRSHSRQRVLLAEAPQHRHSVAGVRGRQQRLQVAAALHVRRHGDLLAPHFLQRVGGDDVALLRVRLGRERGGDVVQVLPQVLIRHCFAPRRHAAPER